MPHHIEETVAEVVSRSLEESLNQYGSQLIQPSKQRRRIAAPSRITAAAAVDRVGGGLSPSPSSPLTGVRDDSQERGSDDDDGENEVAGDGEEGESFEDGGLWGAGPDDGGRRTRGESEEFIISANDMMGLGKYEPTVVRSPHSTAQFI
jgi:hypothetical protein